MVVALVSIISVDMLTQRQMQIYRTSNLYFQEQAYQFALGIERWGLSVLTQDFQSDKKGSGAQEGQYDSPQDLWNTALVNFDVEQATISGVIFDLQGRFNINNLVHAGKVEAKWFASYQRLLTTLELPVSLAKTLADWLDENEQPMGSDGAEDIYYIALEPPYRAANQPLAHISELTLIKGYTQTVIAVLKPYIYAAVSKQASPINVNSASQPVLQAVLPELSESEVSAIINMAKSTPFKSISDLSKEPSLVNKTPDMTQMGVSSYYFVVNSQAAIDKIRVNLQSIIHRDQQGTIQVQSRQETRWYEHSVTTDKTE